MDSALYYNSQLQMFKPTLKRSLQFATDNKSFNSLSESTRATTIDYKTKVQQLYKPGSTMIVPPTLFAKTRNEKSNLVFNPLNYEWCEYPENVLQMMNNQGRGEVISKDAGVYKDLFWSFNGEDILIWRENSKQQKRFKLPMRSQIVAFGQLQNASLHFKNQKRIILVAGIQNYIHLFGIDREKMQCTDFKMCHQIENSSYIQKITFVDNNKILICSDTGQHVMFDFTAEFKVYRPAGNIIKKTLPYLPLLYPQKQRFCEQLLSSGDYIVSLSREEKKRNWLYFKTKQILSSMTDSNFNEEWIVEQTKIEIFVINKSTYQIVRVNTLTEDDILFRKKSRSILRNGEEKQNPNAAKIVAINFKDRTSILEVVTRGGTFIKIDLEKGFSTISVPTTIPNQNSLGSAGLFVMKKNIYEDARESEARCLASLGTNNLTMTNEALWYISQNSIEVVKTSGISGTIHKSTIGLFSGQQWFLLTKKGYFKIKRIKPKDIIIGLIQVRTRMQQQSLQKKWMEQTNYQLFLDSLNNTMGEDVVIESLIQIFLFKKTEIKLNHALINFLQKYLDSNFVENWRDWHYELSNDKKDINRQREETIQITTKIKEELWALIFKMENKAIKIYMNQKQKYVSAYWQALKSIFYQRTNQFFWVNPSNIKSNKLKIDKIMKFFERLIQFFNLKKERQIHLENQLYINRKQQRQKKSDGFEMFKKKHVLQTTKRLEESIETQVEKSSDNSHITESSKALEKEITQAVTKIKSVIEIFLCLTESKQCQRIASLWHIFRSKQSQRVLKLKLIQSITDQNKLRQIHLKLPQLQLEKDLNLLDWFAQMKRFQRLDLIDLKKVAGWLSTPYFVRVLTFFQPRTDFQVKLLLHFRNVCGNEIAFNSQALQRESKSENLYSEDIRTTLSQTIKYYSQEQQIALELIESFIKESIKKYMSSLQADYSSAEKNLNNIIEVVTSHNEEIINLFLEEELVKINVSEKLIMFKRLRKIQRQPATVEQILRTCQPKKKKQAALERQFLNNYQGLIFDANQ